MKQASGGRAEVRVGFAADANGAGIAYAVVDVEGRESLLRIPFRMRRAAALQGREVAYGALRAVASAVRERFAGPVDFHLNDESLAADLDQRRTLPTSLTIPYVALRCAFNRFANVTVASNRTAEIGDLTARAVAEVSLNVAA
jgi:hypothetical protein